MFPGDWTQEYEFEDYQFLALTPAQLDTLITGFIDIYAMEGINLGVLGGQLDRTLIEELARGV